MKDDNPSYLARLFVVLYLIPKKVDLFVVLYDDVMLNKMIAHVKDALIRLNEYHASIHNCLFPPNTKAFFYFFGCVWGVLNCVHV